MSLGNTSQPEAGDCKLSGRHLALQVGLYAEFAPAELMSFLISSQSYALGEAFELCAAAGLVREQVAGPVCTASDFSTAEMCL